jgi:hypothetical protein
MKLFVQIIIYFCIFVCGFAISIPLGIARVSGFVLFIYFFIYI